MFINNKGLVNQYQVFTLSVHMLAVQTSRNIGLHKPKPLSTFSGCYFVCVSSPCSQKNLLTVVS